MSCSFVISLTCKTGTYQGVIKYRTPSGYKQLGANGIRFVQVNDLSINLYLLQASCQSICWDYQNLCGSFSNVQFDIASLRIMIRGLDVLPNFFGFSLTDISGYNITHGDPEKRIFWTNSALFSWDDLGTKSYLSLPDVIHVDIGSRDYMVLRHALVVFRDVRILGVIMGFLPAGDPPAQLNLRTIRVEGTIQLNDGSYSPNLVKVVEWTINSVSNGILAKLLGRTHYA